MFIKNPAGCQIQFEGNVLVAANVDRDGMKTQRLFTTLKIAGVAAALAYSTGAQATTNPSVPGLNTAAASQVGVQAVAFRDSAEADMLRRAYRTLATGDHDYNGHRIKAMHAVEAAAKLLGMDLSGDLKDRTPQALSDDKLREAQGLITQVLNSAAVKDQKRVVKHLNVAIAHINTALKIR